MEESFLLDLTILFGAAVVVSYVFRAAHLSTITGFLVAGMIIGPSGFGLIASTEEVRAMAEIGVMLLLFSIGVEFSIAKLKQSIWIVLVGGGAQVLVTGAIAGLVASLISGSTRIGILIGMLTALSSTVMGLRLLYERGQSTAPEGNVSLSILIFQDIIVLPMMLFLPFITGGAEIEATGVIRTVALSAGAIVLILVVARAVVPRLIERTVNARSRDIFILSVILTVVGVAWVGSRFGISAGIGAFVAGLVISESEYSHQVLSDVLPFRETFTSLFFVSIGMLLDATFILENAVAIVGISIAVVVFKTLIGTGVVCLIGYPLRIAIGVGLLLSQVGEFSIVLLQAAQADALLTPELQQMVLSTILFTMVLSTFVQKFSARIPASLTSDDGRSGYVENKTLAHLSDHTIIVGYGLNGRNVAAMLEASNLPYAVLEMNPRTVSKIRQEGVPIVYGDAVSETVLQHVGVEHARAMVFAISDPMATRQAVAAARRLNRKAFIVARTRYEQEIEPLYQAGADTVITEEFETSLTIIRRLLAQLGIHPSRIDKTILDIRQQHYEPFRQEEPQGLAVDEGIRMFETTVRKIGDGKSIEELGIRQKSGATVVAVVRGGEVISNPGPLFKLQEGDRVHLIGSEQEVSQAISLI
jgi:CPA2 family monovalent cation:H+ antiporter-2